MILEAVINLSKELLPVLLLNSCYALVLAAFVLLLKLLIPGISKRLEYWLCYLVLLRLVLPLKFNFVFSIFDQIVDFFGPDLLLTNVDQQGFVFSELSSMLLYAWVFVVLTLLTRYVYLKINLWLTLNRSKPLMDDPLIVILNEWRLKFWIQRPVRVITMKQVDSPFTCYSNSPIIVLPENVYASRDYDLIEAIIAHEMAHIKRVDSLWGSIQTLIQIVCFFNPLVWLISRRVNTLRECLRDELALSKEKLNAKSYGENLLKMIRISKYKSSLMQVVVTLIGNKNEMKIRVLHIVGMRKLSNKKLSIRF